jgi:hypothetical protein
VDLNIDERVILKLMSKFSVMLCLSAGKYLPNFGGAHGLHLGDPPVQEDCWMLELETVIRLSSHCSPAERVTLL